MSDVFLSYAAEDRERARQLALALGAQGWSVWWDRKIPTGQVFDVAIERELNGARSVVVLWSGGSIASEWVRNEAASAAQRGVLVPVLIEPVTPPLEFRRRQTADLSAWKGEPEDPEYQALCAALLVLVGENASKKPPSPQAPRHQRKGYVPWLFTATLCVVVGYAMYQLGAWQAATSVPTTNTSATEGTPALAMRSAVSFPSGSNEVTLRSIRGKGTYQVLSAQLSGQNKAKRTLTLGIRLTNSGPLDLSFGTDSFRLAVDGIARAPANYLNSAVDARSAKEGEIEFELEQPVAARKYALLIANGEDSGEIRISIENDTAR